MIRSRFVLVVALSLAACNGAAPPPQEAISMLSATDSAGNAARIAALVRRQCGATAADPKRFASDLQASGWPMDRKQSVQPSEPLSLDVWEFPQGQVIRGELVQDSVWICTVSVKAPAAPSVEQMRTALAGFASHPEGAAEVQSWRPDAAHTAQVATSAGETATGGGIWVHVELYRLPWWRALLG